jgi:mRNA-degrading endonuclease RelE of RelBE toxin-antitoxin system
VANVLMTDGALRQFERLPRPIQARVTKVAERLGRWPHVAGVKPLRGELAGSFLIRTGDYRVQFTVHGETVTLTRVGHRDGFYDE